MAEEADGARRVDHEGEPAVVVRYGAHPAQFLESYSPAGAGPHPVVVLIHGGFWRLPWGRELMRPLALDLVERGYAAVNVEYRRLGEDGGGWPGTCEDVVSAVRALPTAGSAAALDLERIGLVGHSAGGHLALWAAHQAGVAARIIVSQAGVVDLRAAVRDRLDEENGRPPAALEFLGGAPAGSSPEAAPDPSAGPVADAGVAAVDPALYPLASPIEMGPLGLGVRQLVLHGDLDTRVPQAQSLDYTRLAERAGDDVRFAAFAGMGHFELIDPSHESWHLTVAELDRCLR